MKNKLFIVGIFIAGMVFSLIAAGLLYSQRALLFKIKGKLEHYYIESIPKKTKEFKLEDFEQRKFLENWKTNSARLTQSQKSVTSGKNSALIIFQKSGGASGIVTKKVFEQGKKYSNWEGYDSLAFEIYNPEEKRFQIAFKIKDHNQKSYNTKITLLPKKINKIYISISELRQSIKTSKVGQMNFFIWKPREEHTILVDNIRLVPERQFKGNRLVILDKEYLPEKGEQVYKKGEFFDFSGKKANWMKNGWVAVPLYVNNPTIGSETTFPVSGGIPFPKGELKSIENIHLLSIQNKVLPSQFRVLGHWPDKSIKWLQVDTKVDIPPSRKQLIHLIYRSDSQRKSKPQPPIKIYDDKQQLVIETGPLKFSVSRKSFKLFDRVWIDQNKNQKFEKNELLSAGSDLVLVYRGEEYRSSLDKNVSIVIEEQGPVKATIKAEGWFTSKKKKRFCKFVIRIQAFKGESFLKVFHTFIYTGYPENKYHYLYKGKRLPKNETIDAIYIETNLRLNKENQQYVLGFDNNRLHKKELTNVFVKQNSSETFEVKSEGKTVLKGKKLDGWIDFNDGQKGLSIVMKDLWQQFPKGWEIKRKEQKIITYIWPHWAGELDFKTTQKADGEDAVARGSAFGIAKTHELAFSFHDASFYQDNQYHTLPLLTDTLLLSASPRWVSDTTAIGKVLPYEKRLAYIEKGVDLMFDWAERQIKNFKWYGMVDYGDVLNIHRDGEWQRNGRWGWMNNEAMGLHSGAFLQYLRTGDYKYFKLGESVARHVMDIDTVHYNTVANDKRLKKRIPDDYSQVGSQHRHNADHWGGRNEETSHTNLHGILLYYYLTGYERAFDVAKEIGEFFLKERMTYFKHPDICPERNISNVVWGGIEMYEATGDTRYKKLADKWVDVLFRGQEHTGVWKDTYNPVERRWEGKSKGIYTLNYTLPALVAYHQVTQNKAVAEMIINATRYYLQRKPYNPYYEALVYSYYLTKDIEFLNGANEQLNLNIKQSQRHNNKPLERGMIYQKAYYLRSIEFLYQLPYAFEAVKERENFRGIKK